MGASVAQGGCDLGGLGAEGVRGGGGGTLGAKLKSWGTPGPSQGWPASGPRHHSVTVTVIHPVDLALALF